ncbi:endonuclease domain-containing protein [Phenylobacterium sp.]|uniref:endonuclease domain-containing protein n=1 Tax=Phenylobacterium sp. TaxID=1871053 RepID=UPI003983D3CE
MRAPTDTHARARSLRGRLSLPELLLWVRLRKRSPGRPRFRRQHPVGPYILDFYCSEARLCVEVDGASHSMGDRPQRDIARDSWLSSQGIKVMRYAASSVLEDPEEVVEWILRLASPPQSSDPEVR